ncbi:UbiX family flavin prenyltransferase [Alteribacillus bidgolensis]|uniref:Flavin prenyltransferase UbiX n=1 Tax=Alteribacillus bidgolensis TaxID=930129 RepID=A0A1G8C525_9BACI|nr:UbiX family flavin prenyltransferase [Alteribacillus bidgolensis]SDH40473.1 4-hydroxy-3-polyprenylbenzoate decarboxylase [Alteribacillus bidgolensis]
MNENKKVFTVAITGASGAVYGVRLAQMLLQNHHFVHFLVSEAGWQVFREELLLDTSDREACLEELFSKSYQENLKIHDLRDFKAPVASGSYRTDGMAVIPCSMGTLSKIANGNSGNLLERAADVILKEKQKLILVPRETPLNGIHLENMLKAEKNGAHIIPAMPGFYHLPETKDDLINFVVGKVLDALNVHHSLFTRWGSGK